MRSFAFRRRRGTSAFTLIELIVVGFVKLPGSPTPCFDDVDVSGQ